MSSVSEEGDSRRRTIPWLTASRDKEHDDTPWVANGDDRSPWLIVNLQSKSSVTGQGMGEFFSKLGSCYPF